MQIDQVAPLDLRFSPRCRSKFSRMSRAFRAGSRLSATGTPGVIESHRLASLRQPRPFPRQRWRLTCPGSARYHGCFARTVGSSSSSLVSSGVVFHQVWSGAKVPRGHRHGRSRFTAERGTRGTPTISGPIATHSPVRSTPEPRSSTRVAAVSTRSNGSLRSWKTNHSSTQAVAPSSLQRDAASWTRRSWRGALETVVRSRD